MVLVIGWVGVIVFVAVVIDLLKNNPPRQKPAGCKFDTIKKSRA